jgi:hypothetical protein
MNMTGYWLLVMAYRKKNPGMREGQILFNVFSKLYPDMANFVCGKEFDPFYDDDRIPLFVEFISRLPNGD